MVDIELGRFLDFQLDDRNDMPLTEGRRAIEQAIAVAVHDAYYEKIGTLSRNNIIGQLEREATRAMNKTDYADQVASVNGKFSDEQPNTVIMEIRYISGELREIPIE